MVRVSPSHWTPEEREKQRQQEILDDAKAEKERREAMASERWMPTTLGFQAIEVEQGFAIPRNESVGFTQTLLTKTDGVTGSLVLLNPEGIVAFSGHQVLSNPRMDVAFFPKTPSFCTSPVDIIAVNKNMDLAFGRLRDPEIIKKCGLLPVTLAYTDYGKSADAAVAVGYAGDAHWALHATEGNVAILQETYVADGKTYNCKMEGTGAYFPGMSGGAQFASKGLIGINNGSYWRYSSRASGWTTPSEAVRDAYNGLFRNSQDSDSDKTIQNYGGRTAYYSQLKSTVAPPLAMKKVTGQSPADHQKAVESCQFRREDWAILSP